MKNLCKLFKPVIKYGLTLLLGAYIGARYQDEIGSSNMNELNHAYREHLLLVKSNTQLRVNKVMNMAFSDMTNSRNLATPIRAIPFTSQDGKKKIAIENGFGFYQLGEAWDKSFVSEQGFYEKNEIKTNTLSDLLILRQ